VSCGPPKNFLVIIADESSINRMSQRGSVGAGGEAMEQAIKHTYICGTDEWFSERTEVSIAARSFAAG